MRSRIGDYPRELDKNIKDSINIRACEKKSVNSQGSILLW